MKCSRDLFQKKKIKTMNIKVVTNSQLSTIESKRQNKQNRNRIIYMDIIQRAISWQGKGENRGQVARLKSANRQVQNRQGDVKNSTENEVAK